MRFILLVLVFLIAAVLPAQEVRVLTTQECINIALENNYNLKIQHNDVDKAEWNYKQSFQNFLPRVDLRANSGTVEQGPTQFQDNVLVGYDSTTSPPSAIFDQRTIINAGTQFDQYSATLSVNWTIFDGLRTWYSIKSSSRLEDAAFLDLQDKINNTVSQVRFAYSDLLKAQKLVEVRKLAVERSDEQLKKQIIAFQIGSATRLDTLKSYVSYNQDRIQYLNTGRQLKQYIYTLNTIMGVDPTREIRVEDVDASQIAPLETFEVLEAMLLERNPSLQASKIRVDASGYSRNSLIAPFIPNLTLYYNYNRNSTEPGNVFAFDNWDQFWSQSYGWSVNWNLFNGFGDYINYQKAKIDERNTEIVNFQIKDELLRKLKTAHDNYQHFVEIIEINEINLRSSKEDYRLASEKKAVGSATILEVRDSQVNLTIAEQTLVEAYFEALNARVDIDELIGTEYSVSGGNK